MTNRLTAAEQDAGLHAIGHGVYLAPTDAAMSDTEMAAWLERRGVVDPAYLAELVGEYRGKTLDEMNAIYDAMHGPIA